MKITLGPSSLSLSFPNAITLEILHCGICHNIYRQYYLWNFYEETFPKFELDKKIHWKYMFFSMQTRFRTRTTKKHVDFVWAPIHRCEGLVSCCVVLCCEQAFATTHTNTKNWRLFALVWGLIVGCMEKNMDF